MFLNINFSKFFFINLIILLLPINFISGNLLLNLNILILILLVLFFYGFEIFKIKLNKIDQSIILLFLYLLINGVINNYFMSGDESSQNIILLKTLAYLRYLFLYFIIKFLVNKELINFKYLFFVFGFCAFLVSIDIIIQYLAGVNLFGLKAQINSFGVERRLSGIFGDEHIAGSYIQRFFVFFPYFFLLFFKFNNKIFLKLTFLISLSILMLGILLSGNRVPLLLFFIMIFLIFIFEKQLRKMLIFSFLISVISIFFLMKSNENFNVHLKQLVKGSYQIINYFEKKITVKEMAFLENNYTKEFETGFLTWGKNKYFGGGIKSFYLNCKTIKNSLMDVSGGTNCNTHPHNYYLEIGAILGIFGFTIILITFLLICISFLQIFRFSKNLSNHARIVIPFFIIFIVEIFPLKTTGSFFSSANSTFIFIIIGYIVGLIDLEKKNYFGK